MKKKIEAELKKIAEQILNNSENISLDDLKAQSRELYEKLAILSFTEKNLEANFETAQPVPAKKESSYEDFYPSGLEYNEDSEAITEPNTEKIKDIVAQMPVEDRQTMFESFQPQPQVDTSAPKPETSARPDASEEKNQEKKDFRHIGVDYDNLPDFEPVNHVQKDKPRSLNDRLKKGINIGLNERLAYIRHLFGGNTTDYNRVLSQLNTFADVNEARKFIELVVKPDYNNWEGKEEYENRFMAQVENKFDS